MTRGKAKFSGSSGRFSRRSPEAIRRKLRNSYRDQFELDKITTEALFSEERMPYEYGKGCKYCFNNGSLYMGSHRHKLSKSVEDKFGVNFGELDKGEDEDFWDIVVELAENNYTSLTNYGQYVERYGKKKASAAIMLDFFGARVVDMSQESFERNADYLMERGLCSLRDFDVIELEDHRGRNNESRPGGIHMILADKAFPTYPVEIQVWGPLDGIYGSLGKWASPFYDDGKKGNPKFSD